MTDPSDEDSALAKALFGERSPEEIEEGRRRGDAALAEHRLQTTRAVSTLRSLIRDQNGNGPTMENVLDGWIDAAILRGLIRLDESGFAIADDAARPIPADIPADHPDSSGEYTRRLKFGNSFWPYDPASLDESVGDYREVEALKLILKLGYAQTYAQAMLGAEMVDVPLFASQATYRLDPAVTCVANHTFRGVARVTLEALKPLLDEEVKSQFRMQPWQASLQLAMLQLQMERKYGVEAVDFVLAGMEITSGELHGNFRNRLPNHVRAAVQVLKRRERADGEGYRISMKKNPGKGWVRPWGAAREFAEAFGINMPPEAEVKRDKTAERNAQVDGSPKSLRAKKKTTRKPKKAGQTRASR